MYTLHHQKKQKQKTRRLPVTKICKGCLGFNKIKNVNYLDKINQKIYIGLNTDKRK